MQTRLSEEQHCDGKPQQFAAQTELSDTPCSGIMESRSSSIERIAIVDRQSTHPAGQLFWLMCFAVLHTVLVRPADLPGRDLLLHLRADSGVELDTKGNVAAWIDQSPSGFVFEPLTRAVQFPSLSGMAGPVIRFDGKALLQSRRPVALFRDASSPLTLFMVVRSSSRSSGQKFLLSQQTDGLRFGLGYDLGGTVTGGGLGVVRGSHHATVASGTQLLPEMTIFTISVGVEGAPPHNICMWRNGLRRYIGQEGDGWWQAGDYPNLPAPLQIGGRTAASSAYVFNGHRGDIAEILFYQRELSDQERSQIEAKLGQRHKIRAYAGSNPSLSFQVRTRLHGNSREDRVETRMLTWDPSRSAAVVVDMWDNHHCVSAARRVGEIAPAMNRVLNRLRRLGVVVIHAPSDTTDFYEDSPARLRAKRSPFHPAPVTFQWNDPNLKCESLLPDVQAGCSCDTRDACSPSYRAWTRQHPALDIDERDVLSDDGQEIYNVLQENGIDNVLVIGVHTNVCVLGRPFGIRQMHYLGKNVVLVRDLTDTYHRDPGFHFEGISKTVRHIETFWAPTASSASLVGTPEFRFAEDTQPHVVFLIGEGEYGTDETLPRFATAELETRGVRVSYVFADKEHMHEFPGIELIDDADLLFVSTRRRNPPVEQLDRVRQHLDKGRPLAGIRTASHAFGLRRGQPPAEGHAAWDTFGRDVLGCTYAGHHDNESAQAGKCYFEIAPQVVQHPILQGLSPSREVTRSSLYRSKPLMEGTTALVYGGITGRDDREPVAWTNRYKNSRIFFTSLGHREDFKNPTFRRLLLNGIFWALGREVPEMRDRESEGTHGRTASR